MSSNAKFIQLNNYIICIDTIEFIELVYHTDGLTVTGLTVTVYLKSQKQLSPFLVKGYEIHEIQKALETLVPKDE